MRKIPTVFEREFGPDIDCPATKQVKPGCEWVLNGKASMYGKIDGTCVGVFGSELYRRRTVDVSRIPVTQFDEWRELIGSVHTFLDAPKDWMPAQRLPRPNLKWPGWIKVERGNPQHKWIVRAFHNTDPTFDGTYEAIGPKIQGNPHCVNTHCLVSHGRPFITRTFKGGYDDIIDQLEALDQFEGFIFVRGDHQMAKVKRTDFGLEWPTNKKLGGVL